MSTGKRLAKRSIIGTRVCAPGPDGLWYSGIIQDVKTPQTNLVQENNNCINLTPDTKYSVRFDFKTQLSSTSSAATTAGGVSGAAMITDMNTNIGNNGGLNAAAASAAAIASNFVSPAMSVRRNAMIKEFRENELIGPGFRSIIGIQLHPGQRVFLTHNGREVSGDVISHDLTKDEVVIKVTPIGYEEPLELKKRLEEVRLLESRRSARLADQDRDTDFARLADMAGDRRRASHSIDVPLALTQHNSRKRRPSYSQDERDNYLPQFRDDDQMDACNAALVLMSLSCSPHSPRTGQWNANLGSSPGSSSASWSSSGSSSPPLSDDGNTSNYVDNTAARIRTTSLSTSDEGIVMDYSDEAPRKRRAHGPIFQCTWKGCGIIETTVQKIELHVRNAHLGPKKPRHSFDDDGAFSDSDHEEEFYYTEIEDEGKAPSPPSPPTLSHRDMARPPHEDPEYQRQIVGNFRQGLLALSQSTSLKSSVPAHASAINIPTSPLAHHNYTWAQQSPVSPHKHARWSPRPSTSSAPYPSPTYVNHYNNQHSNMQQNMAITQGGNQQHHHHQAAAISNLSHSAPASSSLLANSNSTLHHHHHNQQHQHPNHQQLPNGNNNNNSLGVHPPHQIQQQQQHHHHQSPTPQHLQSPIAQTNRSPQSPNRRTRGENKKCRKVYGMDHKDQWCTQCKWKKACSRFGD